MSPRDLPVGVNWSTMLYPDRASEDQQHLLSTFRRVQQTPQKQATGRTETLQELQQRIRKTYGGRNGKLTGGGIQRRR